MIHALTQSHCEIQSKILYDIIFCHMQLLLIFDFPMSQLEN